MYTRIYRACRFLSHPFRQPEHMYYNHGTHAWVRACILAANITSIESFVYHSHRALNFFAFSFHWNVFYFFFRIRFIRPNDSACICALSFGVFVFIVCYQRHNIIVHKIFGDNVDEAEGSLSCSPLCGWVAVNASQWAQRVAKWIENLSTFCARSGKFVCEHEWIRLSTLQTERVGWGRVRVRDRGQQNERNQITN